MYNRFILWLLAFLSLSSCSALLMDPPGDIESGPVNILVVVEESRMTVLDEELQIYSDDITAQGGFVEILPFDSSLAGEELKSLLNDYKENVDGAFLVGDLPAVWYEMTAFGTEETFPVDLFFMDFTAHWGDEDNNGIYDSHTPLNVTHFISRIKGEDDELIAYFQKLHNYRIGGGPSFDRAFIFKDEDWFRTFRGSKFGLERMFGTITINEDRNVTLKDDYLHHVGAEGAEYIYQWIHGKPKALFFSNGSSFDVLKTSEIDETNVQGRFINMFNCSGARFTQRNLAMTYLTGSDSVLALTGTTKVGGNYYPLEFHRSLTLGSTWGNAFKAWYNYFGKDDDEWFLGMVILGDPSLTINLDNVDRSLRASSFMEIIPPDEEMKQYLKENLEYFESISEDF